MVYWMFHSLCLCFVVAVKVDSQNATIFYGNYSRSFNKKHQSFNMGEIFVSGDDIIHTLSISIPPIEEDFSRKPFLKGYLFFRTVSKLSSPDHCSEFAERGSSVWSSLFSDKLLKKFRVFIHCYSQIFLF